jgi:hypothetical protein
MSDQCVSIEECGRKMDLMWDAIGRSDDSGLRKISSENNVKLAVIEAYAKTTTFWVKMIAWLIVTAIMAATAYFASLEARGKSQMLHPGVGKESPFFIAHRSSIP